MDVNAYIASGILDNYCLGFCSDQEAAAIENYAERYPAVKTEIEKIRASLENYFSSNQVQPSPAVKIGVMLAVYEQMALDNADYVPLVKEDMKRSLADWVASRNILSPLEEFDNLHITELPSTETVTNFIVHAKKGHETEMHDDFIEYLYVVSGSCLMDFEDEKRGYGAGDIIRIDRNIYHTATVTSAEPMIAVVQRQACA